MRTVLVASMRHHTRRYVAASVAVVIGVAFIVVIGMLTGATRAGMTADVGAPVAHVDHVVTVADPRDVTRLMAGAAEDDVAALALGYAMEPVSRDGVQLTRSADVAEVSLDPGLQWQALEAGRLPTAPGEAVADVNAAKGSGVGIGDLLRVGSGRAAADVEVVGLVDSPAAMGADLYVPWPTLERFRDTLWADAVAWGGSAELATRLVPDATVRDSDAWVAERQAEISRGVDIIAILALVFVAIAFFVAMLVIANTFSILFAQRLREFALLRCVGVTRRELRRSVRLEALATGVVASAAGVVVGGLGGLGLVQLVGIWFTDMGAATIDPWWLGGACALGVLVTVAAAWLPTRGVTRVPPLAALRPDTGPDARSQSGRLRLALAVLSVATGSGLLAVAVADGALPSVVLMLGGGMIAFVGVLLLGPWLVPALLTAASRLLGTGPVGRLAAGNAVRDRRRAATTAASLLVGVTLTTAILTGLASSRTGIDDAMDTDYPLDATVTAVDAPLDDALVERAAAVDGVADTVTLAGTIAAVGDEPLPLAQVSGRPTVVRGPSDLSPPDGTVLLSYDVVDAWPRDVADRVLDTDRVVVTVDGRDHTLDVRLGPAWGQAGLVSSATMAELTSTAQPVAVWARAVPGTDAEDLDGDLAALAGSRAVVDGGYADRAWVDLQVDILTGAVVGLLGIAVLIALIGIGNTLGLSVLERSRENALLRAMGLTRDQLRRAMAAEGLLLSGVATALGTAIGLVFAWVGVRVLLGPVIDDVTMTVPVVQLGAVALVAALAGLAACVVPARRAARVTPAAGLALD
ncbi:FtsX-like permease family protein [Nocardioides sp. STR2]|uniref:FtsX-like permease family protein n=1 Tax=Nocardioides pini TaxID=2975053 RepID=A0ABT4CIA1_9ACTN|nr:FtsX-like permease family protein [Nocardioides pini]MCY4728708.1 FtsX-like permease family protein [Nocardioides pini]